MKSKLLQLLVALTLFTTTSSMAVCTTDDTDLNTYVENSELVMVNKAYKQNKCTITKGWHKGGYIPGYIIKTYYRDDLDEAKHHVEHITVTLSGEDKATCHIFKELNRYGFHVSTCE